MLETRIRELRKQKGLTLQDLAKKVGTTPQTVQRLETSNMTVSTDWLEKFANVFGVHPADLLRQDRSSTVPFLGQLDTNGNLRAEKQETESGFDLEIRADRPVAVKLVDNIGPYTKDTILIGNRLDGPNLANAHGKDCLLRLPNGMILLRRLVLGNQGAYTLVPYSSTIDILYDQETEWVAKIVMTVSYV